MKKIKLLSLLVLVLALLLTGCGGEDVEETNGEGGNVENEQVAANGDIEDQTTDQDVTSEENKADEYDNGMMEVPEFSLTSNKCLKYKVNDSSDINEYKDFLETDYVIGYYSDGKIKEISNYFNELLKDLEVAETSPEIQTDNDYSRAFVFTDLNGKTRAMLVKISYDDGDDTCYVSVSM